MAKYLLRAIKQVAVFELTGKEEIVEAETEAQLHLKTRQFLTEQFPGEFGPDPSIEVEIKKQGEDVSVTEKKLPDDFKPKNRGGYKPGAPF
jgi:hypothetical protein